MLLARDRGAGAARHLAVQRPRSGTQPRRGADRLPERARLLNGRPLDRGLPTRRRWTAGSASELPLLQRVQQRERRRPTSTIAATTTTTITTSDKSGQRPCRSPRACPAGTGTAPRPTSPRSRRPPAPGPAGRGPPQKDQRGQVGRHAQDHDRKRPAEEPAEEVAGVGAQDEAPGDAEQGRSPRDHPCPLPEVGHQLGRGVGGEEDRRQVRAHTATASTPTNSEVGLTQLASGRLSSARQALRRFTRRSEALLGHLGG